MKSIFWRMCLYFWIATAALLGLTLGVTHLASALRSSELEGISPQRLSEQACQALAGQGEAGLRDWATRLQQEHDVLRVWVLADGARDVLGREVSQWHREWFVYARAQGAGDARFAVANGCVREQGSEVFQAGGALQDSLWAWKETPDLLAADGRRYMLIYDPAYYQPILPAEMLRLNGWYLPVVLLCYLAVSFLVCLVLSRYITRPLRGLQAGVEEISRGNLALQMDPKLLARADELGFLARDFEAMAGKVGQSLEAREDLLRAVSHELRAPLTRLQLAVSLARREDQSLPLQLDRIEREGERLNQMVGTLLHLNRLGRAALHPVTLDLNDVLERVVADARFEGLALDKQVLWERSLALPISGDAEQLHSALDNVVRNALRFSSPGSSVRILAEGQGEALWIRIDDQGPGIPEDDLERVFEPFYRVSASRERRAGGVGLGLSIVRAVVAAHGGRVWAANRAEGGLSVSLFLPVERAP